ncbi:MULTISPECIES: Arm DNA-binding domain-containing protein [Sphingobium]
MPPDFVKLGAELGALRWEKEECPQMALKAAEIRAFPALVSAYRKTDEKGLYLEIRPNGAKRWFFKYRVLARRLITHCTRCARR